MKTAYSLSITLKLQGMYDLLDLVVVVKETIRFVVISLVVLRLEDQRRPSVININALLVYRSSLQFLLRPSRLQSCFFIKTLKYFLHCINVN